MTLSEAEQSIEQGYLDEEPSTSVRRFSWPELAKILLCAIEHVQHEIGNRSSASSISPSVYQTTLLYPCRNVDFCHSTLSICPAASAEYTNNWHMCLREGRLAHWALMYLHDDLAKASPKGVHRHGDQDVC